METKELLKSSFGGVFDEFPVNSGILVVFLHPPALFGEELIAGGGGLTLLRLLGRGRRILILTDGRGADLDEPPVYLGLVPEGLNELIDDLVVFVDS